MKEYKVITYVFARNIAEAGRKVNGEVTEVSFYQDTKKNKMGFKTNK